MIVKTIKIADWRKNTLPDNSGKEFRSELLDNEVLNAVSNGYQLIIDLDYAMGYRPSFLKDAFISLLTDGILTLPEFKKHISFKSDNRPSYILEITKYINELEL